MLARKHGGQGWKAYDAHFHQLVGAGHNLHWTELNPSMMAANVLQVGGQSYSICQAHDHCSDECALAVPQSPLERWPRPYRTMEEVCRHFNTPTNCSSSHYHLEHKCLSCGVWIMVLPIVDQGQRTQGPGLLVLAPAKNKRHPWTHPLTHQCYDCSLFDSGVHPIPI